MKRKCYVAWQTDIQSDTSTLIDLHGNLLILDSKIIWLQPRGALQWGEFHNKEFFINLEETGKRQRYYIMHYASAHYDHIHW